MTKHRVILWGPGGVGEYVLRYLASQPEIELVGVRCYSEDKEGTEIGGAPAHPRRRSAARSRRRLRDLHATHRPDRPHRSGSPDAT